MHVRQGRCRAAFALLVGAIVVAVPATTASAKADQTAGETLRTWLARDDSTVERKVAAAVVVCMERAGLPGYVEASEPPPTAPADGYGISTALEVEPSPPRDYLRILKEPDTPRAVKALFGDDRSDDTKPTSGGAKPSGCLATARAKIAGDPGAWAVLEHDLAPIHDQVAKDRVVKQKTAAWAGCFAAATGQPVPSPESARQTIADLAFARFADAPAVDSPGEGSPATQDELTTRIDALQQLQDIERAWAKADEQCASSSGLERATHRAEVVALARVAARDRAELAKVGFHA